MNQTKQTEKLTATLVSAPPIWRLQLVRTLQILGVLAGALGGAEFLQLLALVPHETAAWLLVAGPTIAATSRPTIELIGDLVDDGIKNDSFKIPIGLLLLTSMSLLLGLGLSSCAGLSLAVTPEGCALARYSHEGHIYRAGPCVGNDNRIDRYVTEWANDTGQTIRLTSYVGRPERLVEYKASDGSWVRWSAKSGVLLGPVPANTNLPQE